MEIAPAHSPAALSFMDDMMGDAAVSDQDYDQTDPSSDEDSIESTSSSSSDEARLSARFTRRGKVPSSVQAILRGRVARLLSEGDGSPRDALSAASTNGTNTPACKDTTSCKKDEASWLDHANRRERFDSASPFNSPIRAVPKKKAAPADITTFISAVRDVTLSSPSHESQDDELEDAPSPAMQQHQL